MSLICLLRRLTSVAGVGVAGADAGVAITCVVGGSAEVVLFNMGLVVVYWW